MGREQDGIDGSSGGADGALEVQLMTRVVLSAMDCGPLPLLRTVDWQITTPHLVHGSRGHGG